MKETDRYTAVTAAEMKKIEQEADAAGLSYYQMMENAGTAAYNILKEKYPAADRIVIFAGKGNNAGDGFVLARLASADGIRVFVVLVEGIPATPDAQKNYELLNGLPVEIMDLNEPGQAMDFKDVETAGKCRNISDIGVNLSGNTVIVDAVYGTGFHGSLRPSGEKACTLINNAGCPVVALDLPSGTNADTGEASKGAVRADVTIAFHLPKPVHITESSAEYCGTVEVADIGIK